PTRHPLRHRVDHVLTVAQNAQRLRSTARGGMQQVEHGHQLALIVRGPRPAASAPLLLVNHPRPARGSGIAECRSVSRRGDARVLLSAHCCCVSSFTCTEVSITWLVESLIFWAFVMTSPRLSK